jgi:TRAP-type C4-dicarboxylate transport system permease small subunit
VCFLGSLLILFGTLKVSHFHFRLDLLVIGFHSYFRLDLSITGSNFFGLVFCYLFYYSWTYGSMSRSSHWTSNVLPASIYVAGRPYAGPSVGGSLSLSQHGHLGLYVLEVAKEASGS